MLGRKDSLDLAAIERDEIARAEPMVPAMAKAVQPWDTKPEKPTSTKPDSTLIELASGFVTFQPRDAGTTVNEMVAELLETLKQQRAA